VQAEPRRGDKLAERGDAIRVKDQPLIKEKNVTPCGKEKLNMIQS
jgi:hypothetical protein